MNRADLDALATQFMLKTVKVNPKDKIWIEYKGPKAKILAEACEKKVRTAGGDPLMVDSSSATLNSTIGDLSADGIAALGLEKLAIMKTMKGYIRIDDNADEEKLDLPADKMALYRKAMSPMVDERVSHKDWLVVSAPTEEFAASLGMEYSKFKDWYLDVCTVDYKTMEKAAQPLHKIMAEGKTVRIHSPNQETDLSFRIVGVAEVCAGKNNIPDGECYTAPVKDSINGTIKFGPSLYNGEKFESIKLTFKNGRVEEAVAENSKRTAKLREMLGIDRDIERAAEIKVMLGIDLDAERTAKLKEIVDVDHDPKRISKLRELLDRDLNGGQIAKLKEMLSDFDPGARYAGEFAINFNPLIKHPTGDRLFDEKIDGGVHIALGSCYDEVRNGNKSEIHWDMVHIQREDYGGGELYIDDRLIRKDGIFVVKELEALNPENLLAASRKSAASVA